MDVQGKAEVRRVFRKLVEEHQVAIERCFTDEKLYDELDSRRRVHWASGPLWDIECGQEVSHRRQYTRNVNEITCLKCVLGRLTKAGVPGLPKV